MNSPIVDSLAARALAPVSGESTRQAQVENALEQLPAAEARSNEQAPTREELVKASQQVNETLRPYGVTFEMSEESSRIIVRMVDQESGEVIRQIPSEAVLRAAERLDVFQGLLVNEKA